MRQTRKAPEPSYAEPEMPAGWSATSEYLSQLSHRQRVLLAVHAVRRVLHLYEEEFPGDERPRRAVEAAEAWAQNPSPANTEAAEQAADVSHDAYYEAYDRDADAAALVAIAAFSTAYVVNAANAAHAINVAHDVFRNTEAVLDDLSSTWRSYHHARAPEGSNFSPDWRTPEVLNLTRSIYDHEDWQGLPVLADALEDAGCTDQKILAPLRHGRDHTRASWALQQILYGGQ